MPRIVPSLLLLALTLAIGCSDSKQAAGGASGDGATVQGRGLPVIWADLLKERDRLHAAVSKETEMWHEDCAEVAAAAAALDALTRELLARIAQEPSVEDRRKAFENLIGYFQATTQALRAAGIDERVGDMPSLMVGTDALLQGIENQFTRAEIGSDSVVTHPGFNPVHPPPSESPI
jgi:uncharacterized protein YbjT (DUF2867 family)